MKINSIKKLCFKFYNAGVNSGKQINNLNIVEFTNLVRNDFNSHVVQYIGIYTIKDLREGRVAVFSNTSTEKLGKILCKAFRRDNGSNAKKPLYYFREDDDHWQFSKKKPDLPIQSVKLFYQQLK